MTHGHYGDPEDSLLSSYTKRGSVTVSPVSQSFRLRFFGHMACSAPNEDHHHPVAAVTHKPPPDWKRPPGRPNQTRLTAIQSDLKPLNKASSHEQWRSIVDMATSNSRT